MLSTSAIITTCERREAVVRAVLSVARQNLPPSEIIVVDDCSGYDVGRVLASIDTGNIPFRTSILPRRSGAPIARNVGASMASGEILMFLDDDDQWAPAKIEHQLNAFNANPEIGWVYTGTAAIDQISAEIISYSRNHESGFVWPNILFRNFVGPTSAVAIRRQIFDLSGGFDPALPALQDYDLWLRLAMTAPVAYDGEHNLLFTGRSVDDTARISTKTANYQRAYERLEAKYEERFASLTSVQRRRFYANSCLVLMGKHLSAREIGRATEMFIRACLAEPRTFTRVGSSLISRRGHTSPRDIAPRLFSSNGRSEISFSVIVPAYNRAHCIGAAIHSVLAQDLPPLEIIVIDDGSIDDLGVALKPFARRITLVRSPENRGAAAARNAAVALARGTHVAFLDSDDTWFPGKLRAQAEFMLSRGVDLCCTGFLVGGAAVDRPYRELVSLSDLVWGCYLSPGTTLVASCELLMRAGGYDTSFRRLEDWDLLLRLAEAGHRIGFLSSAQANIDPSQAAATDVVLTSLMHMRQRHLELLRSISPKLSRDFRAGIAFETAGAYARSGRWVRAVMALLHAFIQSPLNNRSFRFVLIPKLAARISKSLGRTQHA